MSLKVKVALAQDFLANLAKLPSAVQGKILKWSLNFQSDPTSPGINYESINGARDKNLKSVRIDQDWRGIVFRPTEGDVYVLMYVDKHDEAYRWAKDRRVAVNPVTGALQVFAVENLVEPVLEEVRSSVPAKKASATPLYSALSDDDLLRIGTPEELIEQIRSIRSEQELDALQPYLPVEAYEALFLIHAGDTVSDILVSRETRVDLKVDTEDYAASLETPESQSRFVVVADEETMAAILNAPLAQWRVFLHPTQRKLADGDRSGPMRVLGGAGTGKTVLAMHRTKWLAENRATDVKKVFFTTFTPNLATDIEENLKTLCGPSSPILKKIEVKSLDSWVYGYLRRKKYEHRIVYDRKEEEVQKAWKSALAVRDTSLELPDSFYEEELDQVILAQGISSRDEYRLAKRAGRGVILSRAKRDLIWPVFAEYRSQLSLKKLKEVDDAYRDAAALLHDEQDREHLVPYSSIIVDETQDFGPQALKLLRAIVPNGQNDLFFVGDGHQRIYGKNRAVMSRCGIDIRGRARKLYLNYRTTEEIRRYAVATLVGVGVDNLDDGLDDNSRYKSLSHGEPPKVLDYEHFDEVTEALPSILKASLSAGNSVCVMVDTNNNAKNIRDALHAEKIDSIVLTRDKFDKPDFKGVRIATMHRAKGLEFDEVVLLLPRSISGSQAKKDNMKKLIYVAITRAKKLAAVVRY